MSQLVRLEGKPHVNMPYCTMEDNYSLTSCIMGYVLRETGCSFNAETNILNCERSEDVSNYFNTLVWAKTVSLAELHLRTNCLPKCSYTEYQVQHSVFSPSWNPIKSDNESWNCRSQKDLRSTLIGGATGSRQFTSLCDQELWSCKRSTLSMTFRW